jgi:predicted DNA-binding transcriptional regulator AlpA
VSANHERTPPLRPGAYLSTASLAAELDCSESTIAEFVRRGILPRPLRLSTGCVRFSWADVENALASLKDGANSATDGGTAAPSDPYLTGAHNVAKITEGRRGSS